MKAAGDSEERLEEQDKEEAQQIQRQPHERSTPQGVAELRSTNSIQTLE